MNQCKNIFKCLLKILILLFILCPNGNCTDRGDKVDKKISVNELRYDYEIMRELLLECHPGLYLYQNKESMSHILDTFSKMINMDMTELEFYKIVVQLLDSIHCGHTSAELSSDFYNVLYSRKFFPVDIEILDRRIFIKKNLSSNINIFPGLEILSINGVASQIIIDSISPSISSDGYRTDYKLFRLALNFRLHFAEYYKYSDEFDIEVMNLKDSSINHEKLIGLSSDEIRLKENEITKNPLRLRIVGYPEIGIITIESLSINYLELFGQNHISFFEEVFKNIDARNIKKIILDLRGINGGNPDVTIPLTKYLMDKPFQYELKSIIRQIKYPQKLYEYSDIPSYVNESYISSVTEKKGDEIIVKPSQDFIGTLLHYPAEPHYDGNLMILIDAGTFSAASDLASFLQKRSNAIIIGEESGGSASLKSCGVIPTISLPNSKIRINIPLVLTQLNVKGTSFERGVIPDIIVKRIPNDIYEENDKIMEKAIKYMNQLYIDN